MRVSLLGGFCFCQNQIEFQDDHSYSLSLEINCNLISLKNGRGETYPSFLHFFVLEFFQKVTELVLQKVSLFLVINFNVALVEEKSFYYFTMYKYNQRRW